MVDEVNDKPSDVVVIGGVEARIQQEQMDDEFSIDYVAHETEGNILRVGGSIYFLKYWSDEQVRAAYMVIQQALSAELLARGFEVIEEEKTDG